jgi:hypothetical protein
MSNFLAVATTTAAFTQLIQTPAAKDVTGAKITTVRPDGTKGTLPTVGVNIYLYQVTPNPSWMNSDLPTRRANGELVQRPRAALDLHYLLSFYGSEGDLEPQRLLGSVVRVIHANPVLSRDLIRSTVASGTFNPIIGKSNLAADVDLVRLTPLSLTLEELSKLWSVLLQTPYTLSLAYRATVVLIEGEDDVVKSALRVREFPLVNVGILRQPMIAQVVSQADPSLAITAGSVVLIQGRHIKGDNTTVKIDSQEITPPVADVTDTQIRLTLPGTLHGGPHSIQVINRILLGKPAVPHAGVGSNVSAFVLSPLITKTGPNYDITISAPVIAGDGTRSADVTVKLNPKVNVGQRVTLLMNEFGAQGVARNYSFSNPPLVLPAGPTETDTIKFKITGMAPADYLFRVQVDGAESPLEVDTDPNNRRYIQPRKTVP